MPEYARRAVRVSWNRVAGAGQEQGFGSDHLALLPGAVMGDAGGRGHAALVHHRQGDLERIDQQQDDEDPTAHVFIVKAWKWLRYAFPSERGR